jgi:hypothetical protein
MGASIILTGDHRSRQPRLGLYLFLKLRGGRPDGNRNLTNAEETDDSKRAKLRTPAIRLPLASHPA